MFLKTNQEEISGWGRHSRLRTTVLTPTTMRQLHEVLQDSKSYIPRGNGRSYGDASINKNLTINMTKFNKVIRWDQETGELIAESGVLLADLINLFLPRGWFPFVTPGTKFVTLGGAIACDVHGKNHHCEGSFGDYVNWIELLDKDNQIVRCSPSLNSELFKWTIGGMGLTGVIIKCSLRLRKIGSGWIRQKTVANSNLNDTLESFSTYENTTYSVAWIDCLSRGRSFGRSILMLGEHADADSLSCEKRKFPMENKKKFSLFFDPPSFLLNNYTVAAFNSLYFHVNKGNKSRLVPWDSYFYPLDSIGEWNRMYGPNGFFQFQCLLPNESATFGYKKILRTIQDESSGSFLAVLKKFGPGNANLSFPREGFTLALDFKWTAKNVAVVTTLTDLVVNLGGRVYLAKDSIMTATQFAGSVDADSFLVHRNPNINSEQSLRLRL